MRQDLLLVAGGIVLTGVTMWGFFGNPPKHSAQHSASRLMMVQQLNADPDLKAVSGRSPYMRSER